ncbi:MAG: zinc transporter ZupT [Bdellovibrionales bacterium RIFOXYD1_FULL_53_11]|nr:MAG: zinc transporter ZupT [Bdellovibrionales bacterium RIFOXYD1_FULL_53_11]
MDNTVLFAFGLTLLAGLSTGVGSLIGLMTRTTNRGFLSFSLGFSGGVMIYVSMIEIFAKSKTSLSEAWGPVSGAWGAAGAFFAGVAIMGLIDRLIPENDNPHEIHSVEEMEGGANAAVRAHKHSFKPLGRTGVFVALAIAIHNFPEGLATFMAALQDPKLGIAIAVAIAIHNIPEGISVSVPIYFATRSRKKAFWWSFASGLSEPVGAIVGYTLLRPFMNGTMFGLVFAVVAGFMVYISLDELLPAAREYGRHHTSILGVFCGMAVMAVSLLLFI